MTGGLERETGGGNCDEPHCGLCQAKATEERSKKQTKWNKKMETGIYVFLDPSRGARVKVEDVAEDEREGDKGGKEEHDKGVEDRVLGDNLASLRALLERVDGCPNLLGWREPDCLREGEDR